ncbi:MAG TPA: RDD family protein [Galbitalea sp.]|jgi:uncharacterized RDD family membrane protein YckC
MAQGAATDALVHDDDESQVMTGEAVGLDLRPTSFVLAGAGAAIDFLVYVAGGIGALLLVSLLYGLAAANDPESVDSDALGAVITATEVVMFIVVPLVVELLSKGKSLGRLAVGARIVRDDGGAIGFRHAFIRSLLAVFEIFLTLGGAAALVGLFGTRSKRIGDLLAGTYSQYERVAATTTLVFTVPVDLMPWARTADVARIPVRLAYRMTQFLRQAPQLSPAAREQLGRQLAGEASAWVSPLPQIDAELFIAAVIAIRREREFAALTLENERLGHVNAALTGLPHDFPDRG